MIVLEVYLFMVRKNKSYENDENPCFRQNREKPCFQRILEKREKYHEII